MAKNFEDRVVAAVRATGPDALPSSVCIEMNGASLSLCGPSLCRVMLTLSRLSGEGVLVERIILDGEGRERRAYSMGTGMVRQSPESPGRLAFA